MYMIEDVIFLGTAEMVTLTCLLSSTCAKISFISNNLLF